MNIENFQRNSFFFNAIHTNPGKHKMSFSLVHAKGELPLSRCSHASAVFRNELYIYGGWHGGDNAVLGDVYKFNTGTSVVDELSTSYTVEQKH